jgi:hypothetical protein
MSLQGPILIVANKPAGGWRKPSPTPARFPLRRPGPARADRGGRGQAPPFAVEPDAADSDAATALARHVARPRLHPHDHPRPRRHGFGVPDALSISDDAPVEQLIARVTSALRLRTLHSTVIGRAKSLRTSATSWPSCRPAIRSTMPRCLLIGRGRHHAT